MWLKILPHKDEPDNHTPHGVSSHSRFDEYVQGTVATPDVANKQTKEYAGRNECDKHDCSLVVSFEISRAAEAHWLPFRSLPFCIAQLTVRCVVFAIALTWLIFVGAIGVGFAHISLPCCDVCIMP